MEKQFIFLDIDGVVGDFYPHFFSYLDIPGGPAEVYNDPRFLNNWYRVQHDPIFWKTMPRLVDRIDHEFDAWVTSRTTDLRNITYDWLKPVKGGNNKPIIFLGPEPKSMFVKPGSYMLEDAPHHYTDLTDNGVHCYLINTTYNQNLITHRRVNSIDEFFQKVII